MQSTWQDLKIDVKGRTTGTLKTKCPKCSEGKNRYDLSVNLDEKVWKCHRPKCGWTGSLNTKTEEKKYEKPTWKNNTNLSDKLVRWFEARKISQKTLEKMKITEGLEYMPQVQKEVNTLQFNYFKDGELVNVKYRDGGKNFKLFKGAELVFYNLDSIKNAQEIYITEGEIDCLSFVESGIENVVSVPNGASKGNQRLEYLDNCWSYFENVEKVYLATDNDEAGIALRDELARRIGIEKCFKVGFKDCKDANECLVKYGMTGIHEVLSKSEQYPLEGIIYANQIAEEINELYQNGLAKGDTIGIAEFDELLSFKFSQQTTITGIPNHGKSDFLDFICVRLSILCNWKFGIFSPENFPVSLHVSKIAEKLIGKSFGGKYKMNLIEKEKAVEYINNNFFFIRPTDENFTLDNILEKARQLVLRHGINSIVIDPWNTLEHHDDSTGYISRCLAKIGRFKQQYNLHIFLVAHPTKIKKDKNTGKFEVPNLYDISGSAHFFNKTDNGITVYRDYDTHTTRVYVQKVKFKHLGKHGSVEFTYDIDNGRYNPLNKGYDKTNHLNESPKQQPIDFIGEFNSERDYLPF